MTSIGVLVCIKASHGLGIESILAACRSIIAGPGIIAVLATRAAIMAGIFTVAFDLDHTSQEVSK